MALSLATGVSAGLPTQASAANFFERLFSPPAHERRPAYGSNVRGPSYGYARQPGYYDNNGGYPAQPDPYQQDGQSSPPPAPKPVAKVTGPKYYTYKPDKLIVASLDKLTDPVTTASVATDGLPSLGQDPFEQSRQYLAGIRIRALPEVVAAVKAHYSSDPHFIWVSGSAPNEKAKAVVAVLQDAAAVGLDPQDYKVDMPSDGFDMNDPAGRQKALMRFEMQLSAAALTYDLDARRGRVAPDRISGYHDLPRKKVDLEAALSTMEKSGDAASWLQSQNPRGQQFQELKAELATLRAAGPSEQVHIADGTLVRPGGSSPELPKVVKAMGLYGSDDLKKTFADTLANYAGGTDYTPELVSLVKAFQKEKGLRSDGIIGKNTVAAMTGFTNADKIDKVVLAMERARWLPGVLPAHRVFVNEAAFEAAYFKDNQEKLKTRVIVGKKNHQTFFFSDQVETVEFNPYWGVPQSIIINEMLPKLRQDFELSRPDGIPARVSREGHLLQLGELEPGGLHQGLFGSPAPGPGQRAWPAEDPVSEQPRDLHARHADQEPVQEFRPRLQPWMRAHAGSARHGRRGPRRVAPEGRRLHQFRKEPGRRRPAQDSGVPGLFHGLAECGRAGAVLQGHLQPGHVP